jgi:hypothetical protein
MCGEYMSGPFYQVNEPELRDHTRGVLGPTLDQYTLGMGPAQQYLARRIATGTMADWTWKADVSPNQERRFTNPVTGNEVAELIAEAAAGFARTKQGADSDMNQLCVGSEARAIRESTLNDVKNLLNRRARGQ